MADNKIDLIPAVAVRSIAKGMLMMACFTCMWAGMAYSGLADGGFKFILIIFIPFIIAFIVNAVKLFKISKYYPTLTDEADIAEGKRTGKWFGIIFGAEGLGIFIAINIVVKLGHADLIIPVIALVVGLHFFPLARVFKRTIDYYLATWSTVIAILGLVFILNKTIPQHATIAFVGIGLAIATTCYGIYMMISGGKLAKPTV